MGVSGAPANSLHLKCHFLSINRDKHPGSKENSFAITQLQHLTSILIKQPIQIIQKYSNMVDPNYYDSRCSDFYVSCNLIRIRCSGR